MKFKNLVSILLLLTLCNVFSQEDYLLYSTISDDLLKNANAVLRIDDTKIELSTVEFKKHSYKRVVTILNKKGNRHVGAYLGYDKEVTIKKLEAFVYNKFGKLIKKYKKNDFEDQSSVSDFSLYEDDRVKFIEHTPIEYPYTIEFHFETITNNTAFIPFWRPLKGYLISTENSTYNVKYDKEIGLNFLEAHFNNFNIENKSTSEELRYEASNLSAIKSEQWSVAFRDYAPKLLVSPRNFYYEGYLGKTNDWKSLGKWMHDELLSGRSQVSEETKGKIMNLVKDVDDPIEKAKIVYKYVQDNTRYISVQEGIGGIQPIKASEVDKVKYGDCKGLTNYTKALLDLVGVPSYYTRLYASSDNQVDVNEQFVSFLGQTNHVILNIPNGQNDIWLECTSQKIPFGFIGDFTDDRDVFVITPEGGKIKHTTKYSTEENLQNIEANCTILANGDLQVTTNIKSEGIQYDDKYLIESSTERELDEYYKENRWDYINNMNIEDIKITNDKVLAKFYETLKFDAANYASISGDRMLFNMNIINRNTHIPDRYRKRNLPFKISRGFKDVDSISIKIPEGYSIEAFPEDKTITTKFGEYQLQVKIENENSIHCTRTFIVNDGEFPKEEYSAFRDFYKQVSRSDNSKIALIKK